MPKEESIHFNKMGGGGGGCWGVGFNTGGGGGSHVILFPLWISPVKSNDYFYTKLMVFIVSQAPDLYC